MAPEPADKKPATSSARNQFRGHVSAIKAGAVNDEIELTVAGGQKLVASITRDSTEELGLRIGAAAFALVKSSSIILATQDQAARFSARNCMRGSVARIETGAVNTEVVLDLTDGGTLAAIITNDSCERLGLRVGSAASAIYNTASVILGVPA